MSKENLPEQLRVNGLEAWSDWLRSNHDRMKVVWLVFRKKGRGNVPFDYQMALDEALCYGWVDSLVRRIDEDEYMRKFTPRKPGSTWSEINKKKVTLLSEQGRMQPSGLLTIEVAKQNGMWAKGVKIPEVDDSLPWALLFAFHSNPEARDRYFGMKIKAQKQFNIWINMAKRAETIQNRVEESIILLEQDKELGLK